MRRIQDCGELSSGGGSPTGNVSGIRDCEVRFRVKVHLREQLSESETEEYDSTGGRIHLPGRYICGRSGTNPRLKGPVR